MNKKFLKHYMETNPEGTAQTYIFLVDNQDIALNIVMSGYQAICLVQEDDGYYFSVLSGKLNDAPSGRLFRADLEFLQRCPSL